MREGQEIMKKREGEGGKQVINRIKGRKQEKSKETFDAGYQEVNSSFQRIDFELKLEDYQNTARCQEVRER